MGEASQKIFDHNTNKSSSRRAGEGVIKSTPLPPSHSISNCNIMRSIIHHFLKRKQLYVQDFLGCTFSVNHICQLNQLLRTGNLVAVSNKKPLISEPPILK